MTPENFCYWLQGFIEIADPKSLSEKELEMIKNHLNLVFLHSIDPKASAHISDPKEAKEHQENLNKIHKGVKEVKDLMSQVYRC